eukprot:760479-Hanusia_phi.AAC.1
MGGKKRSTNALVGPAVLLTSLVLVSSLSSCQGAAHIVVPCYNEETRLPQQVFLDFIDQTGNQDISFTFVNDGSSDGTLGVLRELAAKRPERLSVFNLEVNGGKAEAVRKGMLHVLLSKNLTSNDVVAFWDADLATPLETIPRFMQKLEQNQQLEMVFGARVALLGRKIQRQFTRHYLGRVFATLASIVLNLRIYDTQCGAKMFRATEDLRDALSSPFTSGWIFDVELIARFISLRGGGGGEKLPCEEVIFEYPLEEWRDVAGSKLGFLSKVKALYGLGCIWWEYLSPAAAWKPVALEP